MSSVSRDVPRSSSFLPDYPYLAARSKPSTSGTPMSRSDHSSSPPPFAFMTLRRLYRYSIFGWVIVGGATSEIHSLHGAQAEEPITLNPFNVSARKELGYRASNSVTGSKVETPIMEMPMAIQAFTEDFIQDVHASDIYEIVRFSPGVTSQDNGFTSGNSQLSIRGFSTGSNPLRNGTAGPQNIDPANIQRVEVVKGPASFLYGVLAPGGLVNIITKRPLDYARGSFTQEIGTDQYHRSTLDVTGPVTRGVSYRLVGMYQNDIEYWNPYSAVSTDVAASVSWRASSILEFTLDYERYTKEEDGPLSLLPTRSVGGIFQNFHPLPNDFNYTLSSDFRDTLQDNVGLEANLKLGDHWAVRGNFGYNHIDAQFRATGGGGVPGNPAVIPATPEFPAIPLEYAFNRRYNHTGRTHRDRSYQVDAVGKYRLGDFGSLRILAGYQFIKNYLRTTNRQVDASRQPRPWDLRNPATWVRVNPFTEADYLWVGDVVNKGNSEAYYGGLTVGLFEERLIVLGGMRNTTTEFLSMNELTKTPVGLKFFAEENSPQVGALFKLVEGLNVYAAYSESFVPNNFLLRLDHVPVKQAVPTQGKGVEAGFKTELLDKRFSSTVSVFEIENTNIIQTFVSNGLQSDYQSGVTKSRGVEFDFNFSPQPNFQIYASYAYTDAYIAENPANPSFVGRIQPGAAKNTVNIWSRYDFVEAALKGWYVAGGATWADKRLADLRNPDFWLDPYTVVSLNVGRRFKVNDLNCYAELSAKNLLDETYNAGINSRSRPRVIMLSGAVEF